MCPNQVKHTPVHREPFDKLKMYLSNGSRGGEMIKVTTIMQCDKCGKDGPEQVGKVSMVSWVRMIAREYGWVTKLQNGKVKNFCPDCAEPNQ